MIQSVKGMHDVLPDESEALRRIEVLLIETLDSFGYREIRLPLLERTELFSRSLGEVTDIVEKEMYSFEDRGSVSLSLRPEGTASCVRAGLQHGLLRPDGRHRLWYSGAFFRRERPQKGRYRQFHQLGAEAFGFAGPDLDAELIAMTARMWERLGLAKKLTLKLNTLGDLSARKNYRERLIAYFKRHEDQLDNDARKRIDTNPLRILDSKNKQIRGVLSDAPRLSEHLDEASRRHYESLKALLSAAGVEFEEDERLVRGLDYYTRTVFEWVMPREAGAQTAVCAGGRYDGLVQALGGAAVAAAGFAVGLERLASQVAPAPSAGADVYIVVAGERAERAAQRLSAVLRRALPQRRIVLNCGAGSFNAQLKRADKSGAKVALIIGEDEVEKGVVLIKPLRSQHEQIELPADRVHHTLEQYLL